MIWFNYDPACFPHKQASGKIIIDDECVLGYTHGWWIHNCTFLQESAGYLRLSLMKQCNNRETFKTNSCSLLLLLCPVILCSQCKSLLFKTSRSLLWWPCQSHLQLQRPPFSFPSSRYLYLHTGAGNLCCMQNAWLLPRPPLSSINNNRLRRRSPRLYRLNRR